MIYLHAYYDEDLKWWCTFGGINEKATKLASFFAIRSTKRSGRVYWEELHNCIPNLTIEDLRMMKEGGLLELTERWEDETLYYYVEWIPRL